MLSADLFRPFKIVASVWALSFCSLAAAAVQWPYLPFSHEGQTTLPLIGQELPLATARVETFGSRMEGRAYRMPPGSLMRIRIEENEELIVEEAREGLRAWKQLGPLLSELKGTPEGARALAFGAWGERTQWLVLENVASKDLDLSLRLRSYQDPTLYPAGWFTALPLSGTAEVHTAEADQSYAAAVLPLTLPLKNDGLVRLKVRKLYPPGSIDQSPCQLSIASPGSEAEVISLRSPPSFYESATLGSEVSAIGIAAVHYIQGDPASLASLKVQLSEDCVLSAEVDSSPLSVQLRETNVPARTGSPPLNETLSQIAASDFRRINPLQAYLRVRPLKADDQAQATRASAADFLRREYLNYRNLYPKTLASDEYLEDRPYLLQKVEGAESWRDAKEDPFTQEAFHGLLPHCTCFRPSPTRDRLSFSHPLEGQASRLRIILAADSLEKPLELELSLQSQLGASSIRLKASPVDQTLRERGEEGDRFLAFEVDLPQNIASIELKKLKGQAWPVLGMQVLSYPDDFTRKPSNGKSSDWSAFLSLEPHQGEPGETLFGQVMRSLLREKMKDLRGHSIPASPSSARLNSKEAASVLESLRAEGNFSLMRSLCSEAYQRFNISDRQKLIWPCLRESLSGLRDSLGLAGLALLRYQETGDQSQVSELYAALRARGEVELSNLLAARLGLPLTLPAQASKRPPFVRSYPSIQTWVQTFSPKRGELFILKAHETLTLEIDPSQAPSILAEVRSLLEDARPERTWVRFRTAERSVTLPLLGQQVSDDVQLASGQSLSTATNFTLKARSKLLLTIEALDQPLALALKSGFSPDPVSETPPMATAWSVRMFPEDFPGGEQEIQCDRLFQLEGAAHLKQRLALQASQLSSLLKAKTQTWAHYQLRRFYEQGTDWNLLKFPQTPFAIYRENDARFSPDNPQTQARLKLMPPPSADSIALLRGNSLHSSELETTASETIQILLERRMIEREDDEPIAIKVDEGTWTLATIQGDRLAIQETLAPGPHRIQIQPQQNRPGRFLYLSLARQVGKTWEPIRSSSVKYWSGARQDQVLSFDFEEPTLLRIHTRSTSGVALSYRLAPRGKFQLSGAPDQTIYYRVYALSPAEEAPLYVDPSPTFSTMAEAPEKAEDESEGAEEGNRRSIELRTDTSGFSTAGSIASNCRTERETRFCTSYWSPSAALTQRFLLGEAAASWTASLYPGKDWLTHLRVLYETLEDSSGVAFKLEGSTFYARYGEASKELRGYEFKPALLLNQTFDRWALATQMKLILRSFKNPPDSSAHELPQRYISPWKIAHDRIVYLAQDLGFKPSIDSYLRSRLSLTSNSPDDPRFVDQLGFEWAWLYLWSPNFSSSIGFDVRTLFIDEDRSKQWLNSSPQAAIYWMNQSLLQHPLFFSAKGGMDSESERSEFTLSIETILGSPLNQASLGSINAPSPGVARSEIFKNQFGSSELRR